MKKRHQLLSYLRKFYFISMTLAMAVAFRLSASPSVLSYLQPELNSVYSAIERGDYSAVSNIVIAIKKDTQISAYQKGSFLLEVGQKYSSEGNTRLAIDAYKQILPLKSSLANEGIFPAFYNSVLSLIGSNYLSLDEPSVACSYGRKLTKEQSESPFWGSFHFLAICEYMQSNFQKALIESEAALALIDQNDVARRKVLLTQAAVFRKLKRNEDAIKVLLVANKIESSPKLEAQIEELRDQIENLE